MTTTRSGVRLVLGLVAVLWAVEIADAALPARLDAAGIRPREVVGLVGVALAPFLHVGFGHLLANTVPLLVLGSVIALDGAVRLLGVSIIVAVTSGLGVWLLAPSASVTVGASGLVFGYAAYLIARGLVSRRAVHLLVGAVVVVLWGASLLAGVVPQAGVSWQGHLFGAVGGVLAARALPAADRPGVSGAATPSRRPGNA